MVRSEPFLKPATQPSQPADTAVGPPATDLPQQRSTAKASSSTQPDPSTAPTTAQTVQRHLASAFDTSRKETSSSSDSESEGFSSDRPPLNMSDDQEANLSDHDQSLSEEQSLGNNHKGLGHIWIETTYRTLIPALPHLKTTPSRVPSCIRQGKCQ